MRLLIDAAKIIELYSAGKSALKIAKELGCSKTTVYSKLADAGVKTRSFSEAASRRRDFSKVLEGMIKMYEKGYSMVDVGAEYDCSGASVKRQLMLAGVKIRSRGGYTRRPPGTLNRQKIKSKLKRCTCCGAPIPTKPVAGVYLTRLCSLCWKNNRDEEYAVMHLQRIG